MSKLPESARRAAQRILDAEAARLLAERRDAHALRAATATLRCQLLGHEWVGTPPAFRCRRCGLAGRDQSLCECGHLVDHHRDGRCLYCDCVGGVAR